MQHHLKKLGEEVSLWKAYEAVLNFRENVVETAPQREELDTKLNQLRAVLEELGECS